jgi:MYND finger.
MAKEIKTFDADVFAANTSKCIKESNLVELINIVRQVNSYNDNSSITLQKLTEYCYTDIIACLSQDNVDSSMEFLMWSLLSAIGSLTVTRKRLWKEQRVLPALYASMKNANVIKNKKVQKVTTSFLSTVLIGANLSYYDSVAELGFIKLLGDIISGDVFNEETFKSVICCFSLLCDGSLKCKQQLVDQKIADAMLKMGETHPLIDEDLMNLAALTYDDLSALKMSHSIGRNKFLKSQVSNQVVCSNSKCLKPQGGVKFKKCSRCKVTLYCSKECQVAHWKLGGHHKQCQEPK